MKITVVFSGKCRLCNQPARTATLDAPAADGGAPSGKPISSLCIDCTRLENAWHRAPVIPRSTPEELAAFDRDYLRARWEDVIPKHVP